MTYYENKLAVYQNEIAKTIRKISNTILTMNYYNYNDSEEYTKMVKFRDKLANVFFEQKHPN